MQLKAVSPYFIMKVPQKDEVEKREKIGNVYIHPSFVWMTRNTQCGIIHDISKEAHSQLPEAKINDILITHHFVQGSHSSRETTKRFFVYSDNIYNYYIITSKENMGQNNQTYGVWNGKEIIPHKEYIFLKEELPSFEEKVTSDLVNDIEWKQTSEDIILKLEHIKKNTELLTKGKITHEIEMMKMQQQNIMEQKAADAKTEETKGNLALQKSQVEAQGFIKAAEIGAQAKIQVKELSNDHEPVKQQSKANAQKEVEREKSTLESQKPLV